MRPGTPLIAMTPSASCAEKACNAFDRSWQACLYAREHRTNVLTNARYKGRYPASDDATLPYSHVRQLAAAVYLASPELSGATSLKQNVKRASWIL